MVMMERFGSPASRIMSIMKSFQIPVRSVQPGDRLLVITDDAMDPLIWQCMMAAINEKGGEAMLCMWPRLPRHFADVPQMAIEAARGADVIVALTTTAMSNSTPGIARHAASLRRPDVADGRIDGGNSDGWRRPDLDERHRRDLRARDVKSASCRTTEERFACRPITAPISPLKSAAWSPGCLPIGGAAFPLGAIRKTASWRVVPGPGVRLMWSRCRARPTALSCGK